MNVTKRNGNIEIYNVEKIHKVVDWAIRGLNNVSLSEIEMNANLSIRDGISTKEIHQILIKSANDLTSPQNPNYQYVASRLLNMSLRKDLWDKYDCPPPLYDHIEKNIEYAVYDNALLSKWTKEDIVSIEQCIDHNRDYLFTYAGLQQLIDKYLVKNRITGKMYETPQFAYVCIAMALFNSVDEVKEAYECFSTFKINLPTPIMAGVRTKIKQFASCVLVDVEDNLASIFSSVHAVGKYTARRAGIGLNIGRVRPINSEIRGGEVIHTGLIPYLKIFESTVKATSQNGIRGGSATVHVPFWHYEIEDIIVLKNNAGTDDNRVRKLDYSVQFNKLFYERFIKNEDITLFSPEETGGLYSSMNDNEDFKKLYEKYENSRQIKMKKKISARKLAEIFAKERLETGRIYVMNIDNANEHGSWDAPVYMSNLCVSPETMLLTKDGYFEISDLIDEDVEIWNGETWSKTKVVKTGCNQKLVNVKLSNGLDLSCTLYHKWYVWDGKSSARGKIVEKRTHELKQGDKLIKFDLPIISSSDKEMRYPYTHGMFCADGTHENSGSRRISLYGDKRNLVQHLNIKTNRGTDSNGRLNVVMHDDMEEKFFVPINYSTNTKLKWLSGLLDGDGCICETQGSYSIQIKSIHKSFLKDVLLLLQTISIQSHIGSCSDTDKECLMPNGNGGYKLYNCQQAYRLCISGSELFKLKQLGLSTYRLNIPEIKPNRSALRFIQVEDIIDSNRFDDTFCVKDDIRGMAIFNGVLTGQCQEIIHPTKPISSIDDKEGEIGICILSALNLLELNNEESIENACSMAVKMLESIIDYQDYPILAGENFTKNRRSLGIGITNFAAFLAKNKLKYDDAETLKLTHRTMEKIQWHLLNESCKLAEKLGPCNKFSETKYSRGLLPIDWYKKTVDELVSPEYTMDWEGLRERIKQFGLRHSTLTAIMPCESSSVIQNSTNGIEPVRSLMSYKKAKNGILKQLVPNYSSRKSYYTLAWDMKDNKAILNICAILQKFVDMSISVNLYYNYSHYPDGNIPLSILIKDQLYGYKYGVKNFYYCNTPDSDGDTEKDMHKKEICEGGSCAI